MGIEQNGSLFIKSFFANSMSITAAVKIFSYPGVFAPTQSHSFKLNDCFLQREGTEEEQRQKGSLFFFV